MSTTEAFLHPPVLDPATSRTRPSTSRSWWPGALRSRFTATITPAPAPAPIQHDHRLARAVEAFRSQALGTRCGAGSHADALVRVVSSTVERSGRSDGLHIWVLLGDIDESRVPTHWDPLEVIADADLTDWARNLRAAAVAHLAAVDCPAAEHVSVRLEVADRVERRGGWAYLA